VDPAWRAGIYIISVRFAGDTVITCV